jgi:CheY-like chemotaxis protein
MTRGGVVAGLEHLKFLIADDNPHMRAIVATLLRGVGVQQVVEADNGLLALKALRVHGIDLAIVDFNMAPMDGVEFTRRVRTDKDSPNPYLPIILMTGHAERARVVEARDAGVTEFVVKPVNARSVLGRIESVLYKPRPYVRSQSYFGPCRRRVNTAGYAGPFRRSTDKA